MKEVLRFHRLVARSVVRDLAHIETAISILVVSGGLFLIAWPWELGGFTPYWSRITGILLIVCLLWRAAYKAWRTTDRAHRASEAERAKLQAYIDSAESKGIPRVLSANVWIDTDPIRWAVHRETEMRNPLLVLEMEFLLEHGPGGIDNEVFVSLDADVRSELISTVMVPRCFLLTEGGDAVLIKLEEGFAKRFRCCQEMSLHQEATEEVYRRLDSISEAMYSRYEVHWKTASGKEMTYRPEQENDEL